MGLSDLAIVVIWEEVKEFTNSRYRMNCAYSLLKKNEYSYQPLKQSSEQRRLQMRLTSLHKKQRNRQRASSTNINEDQSNKATSKWSKNYKNVAKPNLDTIEHKPKYQEPINREPPNELTYTEHKNTTTNGKVVPQSRR